MTVRSIEAILAEIEVQGRDLVIGVRRLNLLVAEVWVRVGDREQVTPPEVMQAVVVGLEEVLERLRRLRTGLNGGG